MDINTFLTYLQENQATLPTAKCFNTHAFKAFNKVKEYKHDATIHDVYNNFDAFFESMKGFTDYTLRNYTQCFEVALSLDNVKACFSSEELVVFAKNIKDKVKELNKVCNAQRKKNKAEACVKEEDTTSISFAHDNQSSASPLDIEDIVNDNMSSIESDIDGYNSFAKEYKQLRKDFDTLQSNYSGMQVQYNNLNVDLAVTKMKLGFVANENARLWDLLNNMVSK
jgi:hypothetical protein